MSAQYSGTIVNSTFTSDGTRGNLVSNLKSILVTTAGWTAVRTNATNDEVIESLANNQGNKIRLRIWDPGSGNCAQIRMMNVGETLTSGSIFLLPTNTKVFRVIAGKCSFFCFTAITTACREFIGAIVPYVPSFIGGINAIGVLVSNSVSDGDTTIRNSLRTFGFNEHQSCQHLLNNTLWNTGTTGDSGGCIKLFVANCSVAGGYTTNIGHWHDGSTTITEPLIGWGGTGITDEAKIRGQIYDAMWITESIAGDTTITFDGHTWYALTNSNTGVTSVTPAGTLLLAVT